MKRSIALVLKGYPRLSETFIAQEILALEQAGLHITLISLRHPTDGAVHPVHEQIRAPIIYLPEYLYREPLRVLGGLCHGLRRRRFGAALRQLCGDLRHDPSANRLRRFGQALVLAHELPAATEQLYAHFIHTPASVTHYAALLCGLPWSCSAHAKDIWTTPARDLRTKLAHMQWLVTCTAANRDHLAALAPRPGAVHLVYHGIDQRRLPAHPRPAPGNDGSDPAHPVRLLSVGRAVAKKGYPLLLDALAALPAALHWRLVHVGGGAELEQLRARARALGLGGRVQWCGALPQPEVIAHYRAAELFVLASRVTGDGDRDGLPNVLMEAQTQGLCCLASAVSGIPELIEDGVTGVLVAADDRAALSAALAALIADPRRRAALGAAGERRVRERFDMRTGIAALLALFAARD